MKLMIDIPDSFYSDLKENRIDLGTIGCQLLLDKVKNGTPLEKRGDCIMRSDAIKKICEKCLEKNLADDLEDCPCDDYKKLIDLPPVTPAEKVGQWEWNQYDSNPKIGNWHCSQCHGIGKSYYDYCPYCKAKMLASPTGAEGSK